jgi:hypothetical protein
MSVHTSEQTVRVGVFNTTEQASRALDRLLAAAFTKDQISVICSDRVREEFFAEFQNPPLPGQVAPAAAATGGSIGAILGGLAALVGIATTGGIGIAAVGPIVMALGLGAASGGFIGAMMTRGLTPEAANYYDQAVTQGKILVAVEDSHEGNAARLALAERIFVESGAEPVPLEQE